MQLSQKGILNICLENFFVLLLNLEHEGKILLPVKIGYTPLKNNVNQKQQHFQMIFLSSSVIYDKLKPIFTINISFLVDLPTLLNNSSPLILLKWLLRSQYKNGFQKLLLRANHVARKSKAAGALDPVQAATTSWMVQGVTRTMKPKDIAAMVLEALVLSLRS